MASADTIISSENQLDSLEAPMQSGNSGDPIERYANLVAETFCRFAIRTRRETNFRINAKSRMEDGFGVARFTTVAGRAQLQRTPAVIRADERDSYVLYVPVCGEHEIVQHKRSVLCSLGALTLVSAAEPFVHTKLGDNDTLYLSLPHAFIDQRVIHREDICARMVGARQGIGRLAADTVTALHRESARMTREEFSGAVRAAAELALLAVGGAADLMSNNRSIRASNLARAKRVIRARLDDADLSPSDIARACGVSLRYLHDLFRDDGRTVCEYLQGERLRAARAMLERSAAGHATVTEICLACGFATPSQFSTAFRRAFGLSPRDVLRRP